MFKKHTLVFGRYNNVDLFLMFSIPLFSYVIVESNHIEKKKKSSKINIVLFYLSKVGF